MIRSLKTVLALVTIAALAACSDQASVASHNLSKAADNFEVSRRIVFYNGITDAYILTIEGLCSKSDDNGARIGITCKVGPSEYKKHFLGLSDNVTYFMEQLDPVQVGTYHYRVTFKPSVVVPDIRVQ